MTDSKRTATEQLLISTAIDSAINDIDCTPLAEKTVYLATDYYRPTEDQQYLIDTVRQKLLASGCVVKDSKSAADLVVALRVGAMGTDSNHVIFGVPSVNVPPALAALGSSPMSIPTIPEVPIIKKQAQRGVAKVGLFAYDQETGRAYWQSGTTPIDATAKEVWLLGAGPWQWGTIYDQPKFAGGKMPLAGLFRPRRKSPHGTDDERTVASEIVFAEPPAELPGPHTEPGQIQLAGHAQPIRPADDRKPDTPSRREPAAHSDSGDKTPGLPAAEQAASPPAKPAATPSTGKQSAQ